MVGVKTRRILREMGTHPGEYNVLRLCKGSGKSVEGSQANAEFDMIIMELEIKISHLFTGNLICF